jgi:hypothetical protein
MVFPETTILIDPLSEPKQVLLFYYVYQWIYCYCYRKK